MSGVDVLPLRPRAAAVRPPPVEAAPPCPCQQAAQANEPCRLNSEQLDATDRR